MLLEISKWLRVYNENLGLFSVEMFWGVSSEIGKLELVKWDRSEFRKIDESWPLGRADDGSNVLENLKSIYERLQGEKK